MTYDRRRGRVVLFGGMVGPFPLTVNDDTWEWDGTSWSQMSPSTRPPARSAPAMAFDAKRGVTVLFGGFDGYTGVHDTWTWDGTTWTDAAPSTAPSPRFAAALVFDPARGVTVLYGGKNQGVGGPTEDCADALWEWDGTTWTQVTMSPAAATAAKAFGCDPGIEGYYDEARGAVTLTRNSLTVELTPGFPEVLPPQSADPGEVDGGGAYDPKVQAGFLFGGLLSPCSSGCVRETTSVRRAGAVNFEVLSVPGPSARGESPLVYDANHDEFVLFGGHVVNPMSNIPLPDAQTWIFRYDPPQIPAGALPPANLLLCGDDRIQVTPVGAGPFAFQWEKVVNGTPTDLGDDAPFSGTRTDQLHINPFRAADAGVYQVRVSNDCGTASSAPFSVTALDGVWDQHAVGPGRMQAALSYDSRRGKVVLFGGNETGHTFGIRGDTWEYDGTTWTQVETSGPLPQRMAAVMAYDPVRGVSVLYGGFDDYVGGNLVRYGDTWEWDGHTWTQKANGPGPRTAHLMVWDSERQRILVYGGSNGVGFLNDLWEWDGTTWAQRFPTGGPPIANNYQRGAYDDSRKAFVVHTFTYGGPQNVGQTWDLIADHWSLAGSDTDWAFIHSPWPIMEYDAAAARPVLFSNHFFYPPPPDPVTWASETWERTDLAHWRLLNVTEPLVREYATMVYDRGRSRLVVHGGLIQEVVGATPPTGETWELSLVADPTCGLGGTCGDGTVDTGEDCDPGTSGTVGCCSACKFALAHTPCGSGMSCDATGQCLADAVCGNGVVEAPEACDDGGTGRSCCTPSCTVDAAGACGDPCRGDRCVVGACTAGADDPTGCSASSSAFGYLAGGGTLSTSDGSATLTLDPGVGPDGHYGIASGLATSEFGIGTAATRVLVARFEPTGTTFAAPGAMITLRWKDADNDGFVDGLGLDERLLTLFHDGTAVATCLADPGCNRATNAWTFHAGSFSEFATVGTPCAVVQQARLKVLKLQPPTGDETLVVSAELPFGAGSDPVATGLRVLLDRAGQTVGDVAVPAGVYERATKTGWKANRKRTHLVFVEKGRTQVQLVRAATGMKVQLSAAKLALGGVTPPLSMTVLVGAPAACAVADFGGTESGCRVTHHGRAIGCALKPAR